MSKPSRLAHLLLATIESLIYSALSKTLCLEIKTRPLAQTEIPVSPKENPKTPGKSEQNSTQEPQNEHKRNRNKDENLEKLIKPGRISEFFKKNPNSSRKRQKTSENHEIQIPIFTPEETLLTCSQVIEISESKI